MALAWRRPATLERPRAYGAGRHLHRPPPLGSAPEALSSRDDRRNDASRSCGRAGGRGLGHAGDRDERFSEPTVRLGARDPSGLVYQWPLAAQCD